MGNFNQTLIMGRLTRDPEQLGRTTGGTFVTNFGVAVNNFMRNADGDVIDEVTFVDCEAYGPIAEQIVRYFEKGQPIFIRGWLRRKTWRDAVGAKRNKMVLVVTEFQFQSRPKRDYTDEPTEPVDAETSGEPIENQEPTDG